jgi:hypothetical protein
MEIGSPLLRRFVTMICGSAVRSGVRKRKDKREMKEITLNQAYSLVVFLLVVVGETGSIPLCDKLRSKRGSQKDKRIVSFLRVSTTDLGLGERWGAGGLSLKSVNSSEKKTSER